MIWAALSRRPDGPLIFHRTQWRVYRVLDTDEGGGVTRTERVEMSLHQKLRRDVPCLLEVSRDDASPIRAPANIPPSYMLVVRLRVTEQLFVTRLLMPALSLKADVVRACVLLGGPWALTPVRTWTCKYYPSGLPVPDALPLRPSDESIIVAVEISLSLIPRSLSVDPLPVLTCRQMTPPTRRLQRLLSA